MIRLSNIYKSYNLEQERIPVIKGINLNVKKGEFIAIMGASGSGKSTLMNIIGCLDMPDAGDLSINDINITKISYRGISLIRSKLIGFVFQSFNLINNINAQSNVELPLFYMGVAQKKRQERALMLLDKLKLWDKAQYFPNQLSGGQKQRVAIARALACQPQIILADEPTGNLDSTTSKEIMNIINQLHSDGNTIILITHDAKVASMAEKVYYMHDGLLAGG